MATDGALSGLLDELRAGGEVDSQGRFTLDRAQARAKMQKFQLADPRRYVLELVQAAVLRGATAIDFAIDADDMRMNFDGRPFTAAELDDLWGSIFADGDDPDLRGVRQLALGLNAALGLDPRWIVVRSGDRQLRLQPGRDDAIEPLTSPLAGTAIHVKQRLRPGLLVAFMRNLSGRLGEELHLRERCAHAPVPITLDGAPIVRGLHVAGAIAEQPIAAPGVQGLLGLLERDAPAELRLLKDGVWIDSVPLEQCGPGFVAVVAGEALRKDVSLAKIVADDAVAKIVGLARVQRWSVLARLVEAVQRGERPAEPAMTRVRAEALEFLKLRDLRKHPDAAIVARALTWPDARTDSADGRFGPRWISLMELADVVTAAGDPAQKTLRCAFKAYAALTPEGAPIPCFSERESKSVAQILGVRPVPFDEALARANEREKARRAWLLRTMDVALPAERGYLVRAPIAAPGLRGELGVGVEATILMPRHDGTIWLLSQGRLLTRFDLAWGVTALDVALEAEFTPADSYQDVIRDDVLARAALHVIAALPGPLAQLAARTRDTPSEPIVRGLIKAWLLLLVDPEERAGLWQRFGVPPPLRPDDAAVRAIVPAAPRLRAADGLLAPILDVPLFEDFDGARRSLRELMARFEHVGFLDEIDRAVASEPGLGREVVSIGRGDRKILAGLFSADGLRSWEPVLAAHRRERDFRARPAQTIADAAARTRVELRAAGLDPELWSRTLRRDGIEAVIALMPRGEGDGATIELLHEGRPLCKRAFDLDLGPIAGTASAPQLRPRASWDDVEDDAALQALHEALRATAWSLIGALLGRHEALGERRSWLVALVLTRLHRLGSQRVHAHLPDLPKSPLLRTIDGGALSLDEVDAVVRKRKRIEWVPGDAPQTELSDPPLVREDPPVIEALRKLLGAEVVVDGSDRLRRHWLAAQLDQLPAIDRVALAPADVWFTHSLAGGQPKLEGEIGLSRVRDDAGLRLVLCTAGRRVEVVTETDAQVAVEAIVADAELPLTALGKVDRRSKRYGQYLRRSRRAVPKLIVELCRRSADLPPDERARARALLLHYAGAEAEAGPGRRESREDAWEAVRALPLLVDVWGGRHTLADVEARSKPRGVDVVSQPVEVEGDAAQLGRLILVADPPARRCLEAMMPVHDLDDRWAEELQALRVLAQAPDVVLPDLRRVAWVDHKASVSGMLQAHLWIPRTPTEDDVMTLARGRKEIGRLRLVPALPCAGIVGGDGLKIGPGGVALDGRQRSSLARQICALYEALARQLKSNRFDVDERARVRAWLARAALALADSSDPALADVGKPLERLRQVLDELVAPSLRRAKTRTKSEPAPPEPAPPEPAPPEPAPPEPAKPEPAEPVAPAPAPAVALTPEQKLLGLVRAELAWVRERHGGLVDRLALDRLVLGAGKQPGLAFYERGIVLQQRHPLVAHLLARLAAGHAPDPVDLTFLVSAVYTVMNAVADGIDADDERALVARLAGSLALGLGA